MTAKTRNYLLISIAVFFFAAIIIVVCSRNKAERPEPEMLSKAVADGATVEFIKVKLFYCSESSALLQPLSREIEVPEIREELYKKFIDLLLTGNSGLIIPLPEGVQLRSVFCLPKMEMLVLDFNENLINSFPGGTGDLMVVTKPYWYFGKGGSGTSHGSPYAYDTNVPLIIMGKQWIKPGAYSQYAEVVDIAPTLAHLLRVRPPAAAEGRVLTETLR